METLTYVLAAGVIVLIAHIWLIELRLKRTRRITQILKTELKKAKEDMEAIHGQLNGLKTAELDVPALEQQMEESIQQLFSAFREKIYELSVRINDLEEKITLLSEEADSSAGDAINEIDSRVDEMTEEISEIEERLDAVEEK